MSWYLDEGLAGFRRQWWDLHPGATVYTIGDTSHSSNPDVSQHAPDRGTSGRKGDSKGEVDAVDVMPGKGVTRAQLLDLFDGLRASRDPRILYVIFEDEIFSSVVQPWKVRPYSGKFHSHVHLSVNDDYANNPAPWRIGENKVYAPRFEFTGKLPSLGVGMEDAQFDGYNAITRAQLLANYVDNTTPDLDVDGVYGAKTAQKIKKIMKGGNGKTIGLSEWRKLLGIYA